MGNVHWHGPILTAPPAPLQRDGGCPLAGGVRADVAHALLGSGIGDRYVIRPALDRNDRCPRNCYDTF